MAHTLRVGNVEITALSDGGFARPPSQFMPDVPAEAWEPFRAQHLDADGNIRLNLGCFLLRAGGATVMVDTGIGPSTGNFAPGRLLDELRDLGVAPDAIDKVVITHMHPDHIGWNTIERDGARVPTFSRARYVIQATEWKHWANEPAAATTMANLALPVERAGQLDLVEPEHHPTPELTMLPTPGHTPGHVSILVVSGGERALILGDVMHNPAQVSEPDWSVGADIDQALGRASRRAVLDRAEADGLTLAAGHLPLPNFGRVVRVDGRRFWQGV